MPIKPNKNVWALAPEGRSSALPRPIKGVFPQPLELGNLASVKSVGAGVQELRINFGPGYRVYFGWDGEEVVVLLAGGSKKRQQADIERAKELWREFKARRRG